MKVLLAVPANETNPVIFQYYIHLRNYCQVDWGMSYLDSLDELKNNYDIIHFHWPESLVGWKEPSSKELFYFSTKLKSLKKKSKLVYTVHNFMPHYSTSEQYKKLYELIISESDCLIHLGSYSYNYYNRLTNKIHMIIPHGIYDSFPNVTNKIDARKYLNLEKEDKVILVFGKLRSKEEVDLILNVFNGLRIINKKLMIIRGDIAVDTGFLYRRLTKLKMFFNKKIIWKNEVINDKDIQFYVKACDILFIPRIRSLNSGNLILGFTFGRVVVGPEVGNIGEILKSTRNPTFNPFNIESAKIAVISGFKLAEMKKGDENQKYAYSNWNWDLVTKQHLLLYNELIR